MIGYVTVGTNDLERARSFYDTVMAELGAKRGMETETFTMWSTGPGSPALGAIKPFDGNPATPGNGAMVSLAVSSRELVDKVHATALAACASEEGAPGLGGDEEMGFYAGYFRDLDGNKLNVFNFAGEIG